MISAKARVRGIDQAMRALANTNDHTFKATVRGINEAAQHLMEVVVSKIGVYQPTGGITDSSPWQKLSYYTNKRKIKEYGFSGKPLYGSGELKDSFFVKKGGKGTLAATVTSTSDYLVHHVYGAPRAGVPRRDPLRVTAIEETDKCVDIIYKHLDDALRRSGL